MITQVRMRFTVWMRFAGWQTKGWVRVRVRVRVRERYIESMRE